MSDETMTEQATARARAEATAARIDDLEERVVVLRDVGRALNARADRAEAQLAALMEAASVACVVCRGARVRRTRCSMCHDSTWDHECDDKEVPCEACAKLRAALDEVDRE